jgi:hypothetical protein
MASVQESGAEVDRLVSLAHDTAVFLRARRAPFGVVGVVGDALFAAVLAELDSTIDVDDWIERAIAAARPEPSLHRGLAGLGFVLALYRPDEARLRVIDDSVRLALPQLPPASLQSGVAGVAVYASLRSHAASGRALQAEIVRCLEERAQVDGPGVVWHTPLSYLQRRRVPSAPEPIIELGIVHGVAGALVGLAALARCGHGVAADLVRAALTALWARQARQPTGFGRIELGVDGAGGAIDCGREPFCVGDPGILRAAWLSARAVGDEESAQRALVGLRAVADHELTRPITEATRLDLCCGIAASAEVHLRMHAETGEPAFLAASRRLQQACAARVGALPFYDFRFGRAGVLLALLSGSGLVDPRWDALIGISFPAKSETAP